MNSRFLHTLGIILLGLLLSAHLYAIDVTTSLSAKTVPVGQGAFLVIKVNDGTPDTTPSFPEVKDLIIEPRGQNRQFSMINGTVTNTRSYNFVVGSKVPGTYRIPVITLVVDGQEFRTKELEIKVIGTAQPQAQANNGDEDKNRFGFLKCEIGATNRQHVYVGEVAPIAIKAYFPANSQVSLKNAPRPEGQAFTLQNLSDQPHQEAVTVDGKNYTLVTWFGGLSATKEGVYPANISMDVNIAIRTNDDGDDSFFNPFGRIEQKEVTLKMAEDLKVEVRPLPEEGRPADFSGAIGEFSFKEARIPQSMHIGEPASIGAIIQGQGSFKLLETPHLTPAKEWKIYDGKSEFQPTDAASFRGQKVYEFSAIPLKNGQKNVQLSLSYFDPEKGQYEEIHSEGTTVRIDGQEIVQKQTTPVSEPKPEPKKPAAPGMAPLATELGNAESYLPLSAKAWFYPLCGGSFSVTAAILILAAIQRRQNDPEKLALKAHLERLHQHLKSAQQAAQRGDAASFLNDAKLALQEKLSFEKDILAEAVTVTDFDPTDSGIEIFNMADSITYSGLALPHTDLGALSDKLKLRVMKGLLKNSRI